MVSFQREDTNGRIQHTLLLVVKVFLYGVLVLSAGNYSGGDWAMGVRLLVKVLVTIQVSFSLYS